jgi:ferredoxin
MKKIIQKHKECIGCGACVAVCPKFWEMDKEEMKSKPKEGKKDEKTGNYELETKDIGCNQEAVDACPLRIIEIL